MYTHDGIPLCDVCGCWAQNKDGSSWTFIGQTVRYVRKDDGTIAQLLKTFEITLCNTCHTVLHDRDLDELFYRYKVYIGILLGQRLSNPVCDRLMKHCVSIMTDFDGGNACHHDEQ